MRNRWGLALLVAGLALTAAAQKENSFTPMPQDEGFGVIDTSAPSLAPEEIIRRFAANESEFQQALSRYSWRRSARVQTIDEDDHVDGEYYQVDDVSFDSTGKRTEKTVYALSLIHIFCALQDRRRNGLADPRRLPRHGRTGPGAGERRRCLCEGCCGAPVGLS